MSPSRLTHLTSLTSRARSVPLRLRNPLFRPGCPVVDRVTREMQKRRTEGFEGARKRRDRDDRGEGDGETLRPTPFRLLLISESLHVSTSTSRLYDSLQ